MDSSVLHLGIDLVVRHFQGCDRIAAVSLLFVRSHHIGVHISE
jgi:hypothetical protein